MGRTFLGGFVSQVEAMRQSWRREDTAVRDALGFNPKRTADRRTDPSETDGGSRDDA